MMKLKKKGFTLTELIGVITILGIIVLLAFPPLISQFKKTKTSIDKATEQFIIAGATNYVEENKNYFPKAKDELYCVSLQTLVDENKISNNLKDTEGNDLNLNEMVSVSVNNGKYDINFDGTCSLENITITLNTSNLTLSINETYKLEAKVSPIGLVSDNLKWTSSDPTVATVSNNGLVKALKVGTTTITVSTNDGSNITKTATVQVTDTKKPEYASYEVKNITNKGYDVYVYGVTDDSGIDKVQFPTWTAYNSQDDLDEDWQTTSEVNGTLQEEGTYYFRVNTTDHNGESGTYYTEIYIYDNSGVYTVIEDIKTTVPSIVFLLEVNDNTYGKVSHSTVNVGYGAQFSTTENTITFPAGQTVTATVLNKTGYTTTFTGWSNTSGTITEATTIIANFTRIANTYEIVYDANGGTGAPTSTSYTYAESGTITLSETQPERKGYTFQGWGTTRNDTTVDYNPGGAFNKNVAQNTTLYAIWKINSYVVNYDANGGTGAPEPTTYIYDADENTTLSETKPTRTGYTFLGWSQSSSATSSSYASGESWWRGNASNYTLYAVWTANTYTVKFYDNLDYIYDAGSILGTFSGRSFYKENDGAALAGYAYGGLSTGPILVSTNSEAVKYNQTHDNTVFGSDGTFTYDGITYHYSIGGYWVAGNLTDTSGSGLRKYEATATSTETSYKLAAKKMVAANKSTVSQTLTYDKAKTLTVNSYTRNGYIFKGWSTTPTGSVVYTDKQSVKNLTSTQGGVIKLYAIWTKMTSSITAWKSSEGSYVQSGELADSWISYRFSSSPAGTFVQYCVDTTNTCTPNTTASGDKYISSNSYIRYRAVSSSNSNNMGSINSFYGYVSK